MTRPAIAFTLLVASFIPAIGYTFPLVNGLPVPDVQYPIHNLRHDTVLTLDENGTIITRRAYGNYGEHDPDNSSGVDTLRYKFTGQELDTTIGLYYFNARYYSPTIKRFLSPDPAKQDSSPYVYAADRPQQFIDPTGLGWEDTVLPEFTRNEHLAISDLHGDEGVKNDFLGRTGLRHLEYSRDRSPLVFYDGQLLYRSEAIDAINRDYPSGVSPVFIDHGQSSERIVGGLSLDKFFAGVRVNACIDLGCGFGKNRLVIESLAKSLNAPIISSVHVTAELSDDAIEVFSNLLGTYANINPDVKNDALALMERIEKTPSYTTHYNGNYQDLDAFLESIANNVRYYFHHGYEGEIVKKADLLLTYFPLYFQDKWQRTTY
ncbi:MAG: hypothetical protein DHS20C01_29830 [marine bacterium B5-7]|nr:MAG: hypothetical protein DHS20C01_29830 [marine bacterium B5-7]